MGVENFGCFGRQQTLGQARTGAAVGQAEDASGEVEARLRDLSQKGALVECGRCRRSAARSCSCAAPPRCPRAWPGPNDRIGLEFDHEIDEHEVFVHIGKRPPPKPHSLRRLRGLGRHVRRRRERRQGLGRHGRPHHAGKRQLGTARCTALRAPGPFLGVRHAVPVRRADHRLRPAPELTSRKSERVTLEMGAGLRQRGGTGVAIQIVDLSVDGFRASTHLQLAKGTDVWLRLPGLEPYAGPGDVGEGQFHRLRVRTAAASGRARDDRRANRADAERLEGPGRNSDPIRILRKPMLSFPSRWGGDGHGIGLSILFAARRRGAEARAPRGDPGRRGASPGTRQLFASKAKKTIRLEVQMPSSRG